MAAWWNAPGPGDAETWPPYYGHPNDPRDPDDGSQEHDEEPEPDIDDYDDMGHGRLMRRIR